MFPLHPSEDLFPIPSDLEQPPADHPSPLLIQQDLILTDHHHDCAYNPQVGFTLSSDMQIVPRDDHEHRPSPYHSLPDPFISAHLTTNNDINNNKGDGDEEEEEEEEEEEKKKKKIVHREVERQRRQYMNTLYASLRSSLPPQFLQGKRAIPDQLNAALDYITWLQKNIKGLETKRAKLKKISYEVNMGNNSAPEEVQMGIRSCYIAIWPYRRGVEVVIHSGLEEKSMPSSRVIEVLLDEGMDVVSCATTKIKDATVHTIQSEACDSTILDVPRLQQKLDQVLINVRDMVA